MFRARRRPAPTDPPPPRPASSLPLWIRILLPIALVVLLLGVIEGASRLVLALLPAPETTVRFTQENVWPHEETVFHEPDPDLMWRMIPGFSRGILSINSSGFHGPVAAVPKPPGVFRIVLMGNSVTFGYKVSLPENYASGLARLLESEAPPRGEGSPRAFEVINVGVSGYTSWQGRILYEKKVRDLDPDLIVAEFGYNDHHSALRSDREKYRDRKLDPLRRRLHWVGFVRLANRIRSGGDPALRTEPRPRVSLEEFEENLLTIREMARQDGAACWFMTVPIRPTVPLVEDFRAIEREGGKQKVWIRQIDFAAGLFPPASRPAIMRHFFFGEDIRPFLQAAGTCARLQELAGKHRDLPIFRYLLAQCFQEAGMDDRAAEMMKSCQEHDLERRRMEAYNTRQREMAERSGARLVDLARTFEQQPDPAALFLDTIHPTPRGHELIAETLARAILGAVRSDSLGGAALPGWS